MGTAYEYSCPVCGYTASVVKGTSSGRIMVVQQRVCLDCKKLVWMQVGEYGKVFSKEEARGKVLSADSSQNILYRCMECKGRNLTAWDEQTCPKCGSVMQQGGEIMWD